LLKKKKQIDSKIKLIPIGSYEMNINDKILPKQNHYYEIHVNKSLMGKLISLAYFPPQLKFQIHLANGQQMEYRTSMYLLESGIFSNRFFSSTEDVMNMYEQRPTTSADSILWYQVLPENASYFDEKITVKEYQIQY
jgi:hypothetical protein